MNKKSRSERAAFFCFHSKGAKAQKKILYVGISNQGEIKSGRSFLPYSHAFGIIPGKTVNIFLALSTVNCQL
jgi:hypothetical protein